MSARGHYYDEDGHSDDFGWDDAPEPNCFDCADKGWHGLTPCPTCNRRGQNGNPQPELVPSAPIEEPW